MGKLIAALVCLGVSCVLAADDFKPLPPPEWLRGCDAFSCGWGYPDDPAKITEAMWKQIARVRFCTHVPGNAQLWKAAREHGVFMMPYITVYQHPMAEDAGTKGEYLGYNMADHPDWPVFNEDGSAQKSVFYDDATYRWAEMCSNCPEYVDYCLAFCRKVLDQGACGFFIDNVHCSGRCFGEQLGKHKHILPGTDRQRESFRNLLQQIQKLCREYSPDYTTMLNAGGPTAEFGPAGDTVMWESYIVSCNEQLRSQTWEQVRPMAEQWRPMTEEGHYIAALSYVGLGTPFGLKDDCFYTYAAARLSGFIWTGGAGSGQDPRAVLYAVRLGKPLGWMYRKAGVWVREFERGFVALNPSGERPLQLTSAMAVGPKTSFRRIVPLASVASDAEPRLQFYSTDRRGEFTVTITVNGQVVKVYKPEDLTSAAEILWRWKNLALDPKLLTERNEVVFTIEGQPNGHCNFWLRIDQSRTDRLSACAPDGASFVTDDLSPDEGKQTGEYMVRIAGKGFQEATPDAGTSGRAHTLRIPWRPEWNGLRDVYSGQTLEPTSDGKVQVRIPPQAGRVYAMP